MEKNEFVKIIVNNKSNMTNREYTYRIPNSIIDIVRKGSRVIVPFGQGNKFIEGFVVDVINEIDIDIDLYKIKYVKDVVEEYTLLTEELIDLCKWMKEEYLCKFIEAIQCVMPTGASLKSEKKIMLNSDIDERKLVNSKLSNIEKKIVNFLLKKRNTTYTSLRNNIEEDSIYRSIKSLEKKNIIIVQEQLKRDVNTISEKIIRLSNDTFNIDEIISKRAQKQREVINYLQKHKEVRWDIVRKEMNVSLSIMNVLKEKGIVEIVTIEKQRQPYKNISIESKTVLNLTSEQKNAIETIEPYIHKDQSEKFLIHGVTGSGKTEIYMRLIDQVIRKSKEAIVLVPEIALTGQMIERFKSRFGDIVAVLHSKLSLGERYDEWNRIRKEEVKIVIGARSAIFSPFKNLGIIIIDEEHEYTYKSENNPKYHTRDVSEFRCEKNNAILVLGSATPSIESYSKSLENQYKKIEMIKRFNENPLPKIEIIDMRDELKKGNKSIFSMSLYKNIEDNLNRGKQSILFLNRRGYSTFISCRNCGYVVKCPHCEVSLTYHSTKHDVSCHYCGFKIVPPRICPKCASKYIKYFGVGTEKIEELTRKYFPEARIARLDLDTTSKKGSMDRILDQVKKGQIDILIGTQMIAKGLDFPNVTLVGVIAADMNLNLPDFRSAERTFQLITQVAGRAGRGDELGRVIVQTYEPNNFAIKASENHDYISFYNQEILLRKQLSYPPYSDLINIVFSGIKEFEVIKLANEFTNIVKDLLAKQNIKDNEMIFGPYPATLSKVKQKYRWQLIIKGKFIDQNAIKGIIKYVDMRLRKNKNFNDLIISIDINPQSML
ncbi:primosomal protein N' [Lutibacter sp. B2]|nr:primosomal protein N' [Lutibacter sp. B2]